MIMVVLMMFGTSASEDEIDNQGAAELLLQSLGKQNNMKEILIAS